MTTLAYAESPDTTATSVRLRRSSAALAAPPATEPRYLLQGRSGALGFARRGHGGSGAALAAGTRLLLYTDGLMERRGERIDQGLGRLVDVLGKRRDAPLAALAEEVSRRDAGRRGRPTTTRACSALAFDAASAVPPGRARREWPELAPLRAAR